MVQSPYEGERIRLRAREATDLEHIYRWINDWETIQYIASRYPRSRKFEQEWLEGGDPGYGGSSFIAETLAEGKLYEKVGFQHEGVLRHGMFRAGKWHDLVLMGLLRGELQ
jgi:RimJ/RimL family protein N-acetyltransferase